jgi:Fe-S-cluster containining protein
MTVAHSLWATDLSRKVVEHFEISLNTPAGQVTTGVGVPTGFVPIASIVPMMRDLGQQAQTLEQQRLIASGHVISCKKGCSACCRMMVPVSAPEAFALEQAFAQYEEPTKRFLTSRLDAAKQQLAEAGLLEQLTKLTRSSEPLSDNSIEPINRAYYALRLPCPFLDQDTCLIYEDRPSACRELAVTSPAPLCDNLLSPAVRSVPVSVRISTVLGLLWAELTDSVPRLIPLPLALDWAREHKADGERQWKGTTLLDQALDKLWRFLSQEHARRTSRQR